MQSFELEALDYFRTLTDLPSVYLAGVDCAEWMENIFLTWQQVYFRYPYVTWDIIPDWGEVAHVVNAISPDHQFVTRPGTNLDPMTDDWDRGTVTDTYSEYGKLMHELGLAIHPWPLQDDKLIYRPKAHAETKMFIIKGIDGYFAEYPIDTYRWFTDLGNRSTLDYYHPEHLSRNVLEEPDLNIEVYKVCKCDRYKLACMSNESLFGGKKTQLAFLRPKTRPTVRNEHEF